MTDVFISYSKKASEPTKALAALLEKLGYAVWWDKALLAGQAFNDTIREKLDEAGAIVVIWTPESAASDYVKLEAGIGWFRNKLIAGIFSFTGTRKSPLNMFRLRLLTTLAGFAGAARALAASLASIFLF